MVEYFSAACCGYIEFLSVDFVFLNECVVLGIELLGLHAS